MAPIRRPAAVPAAAPPPVVGINFGDDSIYVAGGGLPEGDYALEFQVMNYQATKQTGQSAGPPRLGVMVTAHSLTDPAAEPRTQFYSMGSNADKSFAPDPDTGKSLVAIPGAQGQTLNQSTNWNIFRKSLYDCGLPQGIFTNDLSVLDGIWVHLSNIPEPEERKGFGGSKTGEVAEERKAGTIAIVSEIKEDGKPWEGSGGFEAAPAPTPAPRAVARPAAVAQPARPTLAKPATAVKRPAAVAPPPPATEGDDQDVLTAAVNGATEVLTKNPSGCTKLMMRTGTFKAVSEAAGPEMAQAVIETFFGSDEALNQVLGQLGYQVAGAAIKQA